MNADSLESKVHSYEQPQVSLREWLQHATTFANIQRHLNTCSNGRSLRILEVGGGGSMDAMPFAGQGHLVTYIEPNREMLAAAHHSAAEQNLLSQLVLHQASLWDLPVLFQGAEFDLILCHRVLQYVNNVTAALQTLLAPLHAGGIISVLGINRYAEAYRQTLLQLDLAAALHYVDAHSVKATPFDTAVNAYAGAEVARECTELGCKVAGEYGVHCVCDYIADDQSKSDPEFLAQLEKLELAMSDTYPYKLLAQSFQVIARKI